MRATCDARSTRQPPRSSASSARSKRETRADLGERLEDSPPPAAPRRIALSTSQRRRGLIGSIRTGCVRHRSSSSPRLMLPGAGGPRHPPPSRATAARSAASGRPSPYIERGGETLSASPPRLSSYGLPAGPLQVLVARRQGRLAGGTAAERGISGMAVSLKLSSSSAAPTAPCGGPSRGVRDPAGPGRPR